MKLNPDKYSRKVACMCSTCGCSEFESNTQEAIIVTCKNCGRSISKDDLRGENETHIQAHVAEVKNELVKDIRKNISDLFKKYKA